MMMMSVIAANNRAWTFERKTMKKREMSKINYEFKTKKKNFNAK